MSESPLSTLEKLRDFKQVFLGRGGNDNIIHISYNDLVVHLPI